MISVKSKMTVFAEWYETMSRWYVVLLEGKIVEESYIKKLSYLFFKITLKV